MVVIFVEFPHDAMHDILVHEPRHELHKKESSNKDEQIQNHSPKFKTKKKTVGIRIPNHNIPQILVNEIGNPILSTSVHDEDTIMEYSTDPELIHERYSNKVDIVIDAGIGSLIPSTVVDYSKGVIDIIRVGLGKTEDLL